jgi:hypothetical protein
MQMPTIGSHDNRTILLVADRWRIKHSIHHEGVRMFRKASVVAVAVAVAGTLIAVAETAVAAGVPQVNGAWTCTVVRAGTIERPIIYTFGNDGTFNYSSATTINSIVPGPVQDSGFHSRGGGRGEWTKVSSNVFNYKSLEFLYDANGNAAGSFTVDSTLLLTPAGQLCTGRAECSQQTTVISLVKYQFDQNNVDDDIIGINYLLGPGAPANALCNRLSSGAGFPSLPIIPVTVP